MEHISENQDDGSQGLKLWYPVEIPPLHTVELFNSFNLFEMVCRILTTDVPGKTPNV